MWMLFKAIKENTNRVCRVYSTRVFLIELKKEFTTGCSLNIVFFPQNFVIFLIYASSAAALVFYLPGVCTHTDTEGKQRKARVRNIFKKSEKHNI